MECNKLVCKINGRKPSQLENDQLKKIVKVWKNRFNMTCRFHKSVTLLIEDVKVKKQKNCLKIKFERKVEINVKLRLLK